MSSFYGGGGGASISKKLLEKLKELVAIFIDGDSNIVFNGGDSFDETSEQQGTENN